MLDSRRKSKTKNKTKRKSEEKAQQLIIKATSTKALLFQSKQVFYLLKHNNNNNWKRNVGKKGKKQEERLNRASLVQTEGESRIEWENVIGKKLKI